MNGSIKVEGVVLGLCLVALGTLWLLSNLGRVEMFPIIRTWWPLALVVWGVLELGAFAARRISESRSGGRR
jgi:hypothetical protein